MRDNKERKFNIRPAEISDYERILEIYAGARQFMTEHGNPRQWAANGWPPDTLVKEDIEVGRNYVCECDGCVEAVFVFFQGFDIDPTYRVIEDGSWKDDSAYGVVHRIATSHKYPGIGSACLDWAWNKINHLRIDTHGDNAVMKSFLKKNGFEERGVIYVVEDNDPRIAFEKV